jgi:hypothetical protein
MAEKRMFSKQIIDSDAFLEMPLSTQALYFHLSMRADDDGFVDNPKKIQRIVNASGDDLKLLIAKRYILTFESGVIVIKHWRMHNTLRPDRYKETVYIEEMATIELKKNKSYTEKNKLNEVGIPDVNQWEPQISIDKNSIDIDKKKNSHEYEKKYSDVSFEMKCVNYLISSIKSEMPDAKLPDTDKDIDKWCDHIEKMVRLDKRTNEDIYNTLVYARTDIFWKVNIRSTSKFREKYETLYLQMKSKKENKPQGKPKQTNNFHNAPQREYTAEDYANFEKKLINKGL